MATTRSAGPGRDYVRTLGRAALTNGSIAAQLLRASLMVLAVAHVVLILAHMPDSISSVGRSVLVWMLASALTVVALAALSQTGNRTPAHRQEVPPAPAAQPSPEVLDLLARLNHDLRTPLNAVIGFSDVMQREMFGPLGNERYQEYARHIRASGDVLLKATEDTLAMTSLLAAPPCVGLRRVALAEILATIRAELDAEGREAAIVVRGDANAHVTADPDALLQAVRHVLRSAACHAGCLMPVEVEAHVQDGRVSMTVLVGPAPDVSLGEPRPEPLGLGRDTMSMRLARVLLGLQGMGLAHETSATSWQARIDMSSACAPSAA